MESSFNVIPTNMYPEELLSIFKKPAHAYLLSVSSQGPLGSLWAYCFSRVAQAVGDQDPSYPADVIHPHLYYTVSALGHNTNENHMSQHPSGCVGSPLSSYPLQAADLYLCYGLPGTKRQWPAMPFQNPFSHFLMN